MSCVNSSVSNMSSFRQEIDKAPRQAIRYKEQNEQTERRVKVAIRTREEYIESLRKQKPRVYMKGEKIENIVDHPAFQAGINNASVSYEVAHDPKYRDVATVMSPLINEEISRWTHLMRDEQDAIAKIKLNQGIGDYLCPCSYRCMTSDFLHCMWAVSHDIDKKHDTNYHQNVLEFVKDAQKNDWIIGGSVVPVKGDRSKGPSEQADPDMYLRIVERRKDGIVVRGAKPHSTASPYTNMIIGLGTEPLKDYAVGFWTPVDTEGLIMICKPNPAPLETKEMENPLSSRFGGHVETMLVFDDMFVPWERVFICGEYDVAYTCGMILSASHTWHKCMCRCAGIDLFIGATALIADYNGLEKAPHIQDNLAEMVMDAEIMHALVLTAALEGWKHESGVYCPKSSSAAVGKAYSAEKLAEERFLMQDTAGGLVATMASEEDYRSPVTGKYLEKYYKGREGVPTEHRIRAFKLIEDLLGSEYAGWYHAMCITGGGPPFGHKMTAMRGYDFEKSKGKAMRAARIK